MPTESTIGALLDSSFDKVAEAFDLMAARIISLESRVALLEQFSDEPVVEPDVPEPTDNTTHVLPYVAQPVTVSATENTGASPQSGQRMYVREGLALGQLSLINVSDVELVVDGRVESVWIAGATRVRITGKGTVGSVTTSEWAGGMAGHRTESLTIDGVTMDTEGTAMDLQFVSDVLVRGVTATRTRRYCIWASNASNVFVLNNTFSTQGDESCVRFQSVSTALVDSNRINSSFKHCFRVHGASSNVDFSRNLCSGPRGVMLATMVGDALMNITIKDSSFSNATSQLLGLPIAAPNQLQGFTWENNDISGSVDDISSYRSSTPWTFKP